MGSFTKIYSRKFRPEENVVLTWDSGYKNVELIHNDRIVQQWDNPNGFIKGVKINDEQLGKIKLSFTSTRPLQFELTI